MRDDRKSIGTRDNKTITDKHLGYLKKPKRIIND